VHVEGWEKSPMIHLRLVNQRISREEQCELLAKVVTTARSKGLAVVCPQYVNLEEFYLPAPSIRLVSSYRPYDLQSSILMGAMLTSPASLDQTVSAEHAPKEVEAALATLGGIFSSVCPSGNGLSMSNK
jgi:hypothetical protein